MKKIIEKNAKKLPYRTPRVGIAYLEISDVIATSPVGGDGGSGEQSTGGGYSGGAWS
jgi:hypothetical protein